MKQTCLVVALALIVSACSGKDSPTAPGSNSPTRIISLAGSMNYGTVPVGTAVNQGFTITNQGTSLLTVTGLSVPCASMFKGTFTAGTIAAGATQSVIATFTPTTEANCSGLLTVNADQTSGVNTITVTAAGTYAGVPLWTMSGSGNTVFTMPAQVSRVRIQGAFSGSSSNFIIKVGGSLVVNELLGTSWGPTTYDGTHLVKAGTTEITNSSGVSWTFTEVR